MFSVVGFVFLIPQPERIDPQSFGHGYDVRSDIWSLGIMLVSSSVDCALFSCVLLLLDLPLLVGLSLVIGCQKVQKSYLTNIWELWHDLELAEL